MNSKELHLYMKIMSRCKFLDNLNVKHWFICPAIENNMNIVGSTLVINELACIFIKYIKLLKILMILNGKHYAYELLAKLHVEYRGTT